LLIAARGNPGQVMLEDDNEEERVLVEKLDHMVR
jgi:hypothetical protein